MSDYIPYISEFGPISGRSLVFFHGFPGSHKQSAMIEAPAEKLGIRIFSVDRPGYGFSKPMPGGTLLKFMESVSRALALREVNEFFVMGVSGGNPSAVTAASFFGDRVLGLGSVCGLAPFGSAGFNLHQITGLTAARKLPEPVLKKMISVGLHAFDPSVLLKVVQGRASPRDREVLKDPVIRDAVLDSILGPRDQGPEGMVFDLKTYSMPWPVEFSKITCRHLIWHGQEDRVLNFAMAEELHRLNPRSALKLYPKDGHYSLPILRAEEMLTDLVKD